MAAARDGDILLWLHNKLGTSADTWSEGSICSQLNIEVLRNIKECFVELQTQVKLKLLLSFFHIPKRNVEEWKGELEDILEVALVDSEPWVTMLAEVMNTFPSSGNLNLDIKLPAENQRMTQDLVSDMRKLVKKHSELGLLPMECNYLNRNAFLAAAGQQVPLTKHFALKRKPKAAALRVELLTRSADAQANVKKSQLPSVPVRSRVAPRKSDTTPMRGIPSRVLGSGLRTSGLNTTPMSRPLARTNLNRKDGGIKLLEITESPMAVQQSKKRRKLHDTPDVKGIDSDKNKDSHVDSKSNITLTPPSSKTKSIQHHPPPAPEPDLDSPTPDYAAGLTPNPSVASPATPGTPLMAVSASPGSSSNLTPVHLSQASPSPVPGERMTPVVGTPISLPPQKIIIANSQLPAGTPTILYRTVGSAAGGYTHAELVPATPVSLGQTDSAANPGQPQYATLQPVQPDMIYTGVNLATNISSVTPGTQVIAIAPQNSSLVQNHQVVQLQQPLQIPQAQPVVQPQQKRNLSLTKEQMAEAQEMFKTSNKVTRPEKALILGFMAGSRDNPCPHLGNIVTIKLSEQEEMVSQPDGAAVKMLAETHFQMNYNTGEWQRIRKYRPLILQ